jgi:uncharacterized protein
MRLELSNLKKIISNNAADIKSFGVEEIYVFGSVARGEAKENSDVDLFVVLSANAKMGLIKFITLKNFLADKIGKNVDLVTKTALHPMLREQILKEALRVA